ncbi:hypothetical protein ACTXIZ_13075, partial [Psychrobacter celer]
PKYKSDYQNGNLISELIPDVRQRGLLLNSLKTNHIRALELLEDYNIICMKYSLEMDLLCSSKAVVEMSSILNLSPADSNLNFLLTKRGKMIKKIGNMLQVLETMSNRNLPYAFKKIKKKLVELSKSY